MKLKLLSKILMKIIVLHYHIKNFLVAGRKILQLRLHLLRVRTQQRTSHQEPSAYGRRGGGNPRKQTTGTECRRHHTRRADLCRQWRTDHTPRFCRHNRRHHSSTRQILSCSKGQCSDKRHQNYTDRRL